MILTVVFLILEQGNKILVLQNYVKIDATIQFKLNSISDLADAYAAYLLEI